MLIDRRLFPYYEAIRTQEEPSKLNEVKYVRCS